MTVLLLAKPDHHSIADWDWERGAAGRSLSATHFVSTPTALRYGGLENAVLSRLASCQLLPQGEIRTWLWPVSASGYMCCFRNQAALGTANRLNQYFLLRGGNFVALYRSMSGSTIYIGQASTTITLGAWTHWRFIWWNGVDPTGADALNVLVYKEIAGLWVQQGNVIYHTANSWKTSGTNRCGLLCNSLGSDYEWWDDTEIWGP